MSVFNSLQRVDDILHLRADSDRTAIVEAASGKAVSYGDLYALVHTMASGKAVSYGDLYALVHTMAQSLRAAGCGPGSRVMVAARKGIGAVAAGFAVLSMDACHIPLDPAMPPQRLGHIYHQVRPACMVEDDSAALIPAMEADACPVLRIASPGEPAALTEVAGHAAGPGTRQDPPHGNGRLPAYILFTSGSTGRPKGVQISHASVLAFLASAQAVAGYEKPRFLNTSPLFFDAAILDVYGTLALGGTLILLDDIVFPSQLTAAIKRYRVTDTLMVSSLLKLLTHKLSDMSRANMHSLQSIWYGAEPCPTSVLKAIRTHAPHVHFIHGYGPTEATHSTTLFSCRDDHCLDLPFLPIGKPLPTIEIRIVDDRLHPVSGGQTGELLVGGVQLMQGYLNDPQRTREVTTFIDGQRFYRTGDYVKALPDGNLFFMGRKDDAVKIRGNLVCLSEVEQAVLRHVQVRDACALAYDCQDKVYDKEIALFVFAASSFRDETDLRRHLAAHLPGYMIPAWIAFLDESQCAYLPTGKLDKKHLASLMGIKDHNAPCL